MTSVVSLLTPPSNIVYGVVNRRFFSDITNLKGFRKKSQWSVSQRGDRMYQHSELPSTEREDLVVSGLFLHYTQCIH